MSTNSDSVRKGGDRTCNSWCDSYVTGMQHFDLSAIIKSPTFLVDAHGTHSDILETKQKMKRNELVYAVGRAQEGDADYFRTASMDVLQNARDSRKYTILAWAVMRGHLECTKVIAERCPSLVYFQNFEGSTALHNAAWRSNTDITKFLISLSFKLESGEDIPIDTLFGEEDLPKSKALMMVDHGGSTPLHWAVWNQQLETVRLLIEADPDVVYGANSAGETPLQMAIRQDRSSPHPGASISAKIRDLILKMQPSQGTGDK